MGRNTGWVTGIAAFTGRVKPMARPPNRNGVAAASSVIMPSTSRAGGAAAAVSRLAATEIGTTEITANA